jgi:spermidine/putrescine-binding protein
MSAPSRSGTTHLTVETIIQGEGWEKGWALMKDICGNLASVTERSFGVPDGVNNGTFGIGIVIDFFGFSSQATGYPVEFVYPTVTTLVPANIAIVNNAKHPKAAGAFIEFLLSEEGQEILLNPQIMRLPVNPTIYAKAPKGLPNPFEDSSIGAAVKFDLDLSKGRYNLFNSLFDQVITFRLESLVAATKAIQEGEALLAQKSDDKAAQLLKEARALVRAVPITEEEANNPEFAQIFTKKRKKATDEVPQRQAEVEEQWDSFTKENYKAALAKAEEAIALLK